METRSDRSPELGEQKYQAVLERMAQVGKLLGVTGRVLLLNGNTTWGGGLQVASAVLLTAVRFASQRR